MFVQLSSVSFSVSHAVDRGQCKASTVSQYRGRQTAAVFRLKHANQLAPSCPGPKHKHTVASLDC